MIEHLIINAAFIIGLSMISQPGYVLNWYRSLCERIPFFNKPLILCQLCMSSIYGLLYQLLVLKVWLFHFSITGRLYSAYGFDFTAPSIELNYQVCFYLIELVFAVATLKTLLDILVKVRDYLEIRLHGLNLEVKDLLNEIKAEKNA